ncbi:MAG: hypothetical protein NDI90_18010 [Nitrospira sp. BO4]|nr:hypothetical protein [Nitrospira sp. BO4]
MKTASLSERITGRVSDFGPLFEYTVKLVLLTSFLELVLYRLVSRLGMHLSKMAADHPWITPTFTALTEVGTWLLNIVAVLLFLALTLTMVNRWGGRDTSKLVKMGIAGAALLLFLTVLFLVVQPGMLGAIIYNGLTLLVLTLFVSEYVITHREPAQRILAATYYLGVSGWLYYQIISTVYSLAGTLAAPPLVYESHRAGEALMVLASYLVFVAYGSSKSLSLRTTNRRQRNRAIWFWSTTGIIFTVLIVADYFLDLYSPAFASAFRQASQGIGWIFQFGMGYTFYLPFAVYVGGLLCWSYTVIKLVMTGRLAGYGIGLMFIAGYALLFSNLTLMVVLGVMLLALDRAKAAATEAVSTTAGPMMPATDGLITGRA